MNVSTRFLTCEPNLRHLPDYIDEADKFYEFPLPWLQTHLPTADIQTTKVYPYAVEQPLAKLPSHIITFDKTTQLILQFLESNHYSMCGKVFHSFYPDGKTGEYFDIHCLPDIW